MRTLLVVALVAAGAFVACSPPCDQISVTPTSVCLRADAGQPTANTPFNVNAQHNFGGSVSCVVTVDGGSISLDLAPTTSCASSPINGAAAPFDSVPGVCAIPALAAGNYTITSTSPTTSFALPYDGGVAPCQ